MATLEIGTQIHRTIQLFSVLVFFSQIFENYKMTKSSIEKDTVEIYFIGDWEKGEVLIK